MGACTCFRIEHSVSSSLSAEARNRERGWKVYACPHLCSSRLASVWTWSLTMKGSILLLFKEIRQLWFLSLCVRNIALCDGVLLSFRITQGSANGSWLPTHPYNHDQMLLAQVLFDLPNDSTSFFLALSLSPLLNLLLLNFPWTSYTAEDDFGLLILQPSLPKCWYCRHVPPFLAYEGLGIKSTALWMLGKYLSNWVSSLVLPSWILPPRKLFHVLLIV